MAREKAEVPGQEALITSAPLTTEVHIRDFSDQAPAVSLVEHHLQQIHALNLFSTIHEKEWMIGHPDVVVKRYPKNHAKILQTLTQERLALVEEAKTEFFRSLGYYAVQEAGWMDNMPDYTKDTEHRWTLFQARYRSVPKGPARYQEIDRLLAELKNFNNDRTAYNRSHGLRPHAPDKAVVRRSIEDKKPVARPLPTRERLIAIQEDPRAGYLPANNREKNTVLAWLDYFDNPEYPLGIGNQLLEVLVHQQKKRTHLEGVRAVESIAWELGDYLKDAVKGYNATSKFIEDMEGVAPTAKIADVDDIDEEAMRYIIRYEAVDLVLRGRAHPGVRDVLLAKEKRWVNGGSDPGKHKEVHNHFTAPDEIRPRATEQYIDDRWVEMSVRSAVKFATANMQNDRVRIGFMLRCFSDITSALTGEYRASESIAAAIQESLAAVKDEPIVQLILNERTRQTA